MRFITTFLITLLACLISGCDKTSATNSGQKKTSYVTAISISNDGKLILSAHAKNSLVIWDLQNRKKDTLSTKSNIFSPYFINNKNDYMWQDTNNVVHINNSNHKPLKEFKHFPTYGHVITPDLKSYLSINDKYGIYHSYGENLKQIKTEGGSFLGFGKLLNIMFSPSYKYFLTSGFTASSDKLYSIDSETKLKFKNSVGVNLWDHETGKLEQKILGNRSKTFATFSPDGQYVVSGDENGIVNVWNINNIIKHKLASIHHGRDISNGKDFSHLKGDDFAKAVFDKTGLIATPNDFTGGRTLSIKFISKQYYLRIFHNEHHIALYHIDNDMPLKYFELGDAPFPSVKEYYRNVSIDTAPEAGILVTGQHRGSGINVYKFDKEKLTLERIWVTQ